jgi:hypothetical protein
MKIFFRNEESLIDGEAIRFKAKGGQWLHQESTAK